MRQGLARSGFFSEVDRENMYEANPKYGESYLLNSNFGNFETPHTSLIFTSLKIDAIINYKKKNLVFILILIICYGSCWPARYRV